MLVGADNRAVDEDLPKVGIFAQCLKDLSPNPGIRQRANRL